MHFKSMIVLLFVVFSFSGCNSQNPAVKNLNPEQFEKGISKGDVQLVDVRTPEEFKEKHIAGAQNININDPDFEKKMNALDKSKPTYIYCLAGGRSKKAADWAASNGFTSVSNLEFGINSWLQADKPVVTASGGKAEGGMSFDDYISHLKAAQKLVLVDFNATWCGPCKTLRPIVQKVLKKNADKVELFDIDVDQNSTVSNTMNVRGIPLLILYKQGREVWRNMGLTDEGTIADKVKEFSK